MRRRFDMESFRRLPVVGILRGFGREETARMIAAAVQGGLRNVEITMNTPGAADCIADAVAATAEHVNVGAGTVCTLQDLETALEAGACFIVTPAVVPEVISACVERQVPVFPGALTPTEILTAAALGATMVKLFPADLHGPGYLKSLRGPLGTIELMPTGGMSLASMAAYWEVGAAAWGVGTPLFHPQRVAAEDWAWIEQQAAAFAAEYAALAARGR